MLKLVIGMQNKGFTLIEILVVILIIGITIGFTLLSFGDFGVSRRITMTAEQLVNYVKLTRQQAILASATYGIQVDQSGYQMLRFQAPHSWQPLSHEAIFKHQPFPKHTVVQFANKVLMADHPQIVINPTGDLTPFVLYLGTKSQPKLVTIVGEDNGTITLTQGKPS